MKNEFSLMEKRIRTGAYGLVVQENKVLLTEKTKGPYKGLLDLPGGGIEFGESPLEALSREFAEEVALSFEKASLFDVIHAIGDENSHLIGILFLVSHLTPLASLPEDPHSWYPLEELSSERLAPFAAHILKKAFPSKLFSL